MSRAILTVLLIALLVVTTSSVAAADSSHFFPTPNGRTLAFALGLGVVAFVFDNYQGGGDLIVHAVNGFGNAVPISVFGYTAPYFWFNFVGFSGPFPLFDVYGDRGFGWVFVARVALNI